MSEQIQIQARMEERLWEAYHEFAMVLDVYKQDLDFAHKRISDINGDLAAIRQVLVDKGIWPAIEAAVTPKKGRKK